MIVRMILSFKSRVIDRIVARYFLKHVKEHGEKISICDCDIRAIAGLERIHLGSNISIGSKVRIMCTEADLYIDDYCMIAPEVLIVTGDHRIDCPGMRMCEVTEKLPENDQPVHIHKDVWIGARAIILKGAEIGEGSVIAAGAVVIGKVPPYSIYISKNNILPRFTEEQMKQHKMELSKRESKNCLQN